MATPVADPAAILAVTDILKEVWVDDALEDQLLSETILLDYVEDVTDYTDSDGLRASVPLRTGRTGGISSRGIGGTLGPAGHQRVGKAIYNYTFHYVTVKLLAPVIARMKTNRQSCVREVDFEVKGALNDGKMDLQRQYHSAGDANMGTVASAALGATALVMNNDFGRHAIRCGWIYEGMWIDVGTAANSIASVQGAKVTDVDPDTYTVTVDTPLAAATAAGLPFSIITRYGNRSGATSYEMNGLGSIIDDTLPLGGIDPGVPGNKYWKAIVLANGGTNRAMSIDLLLQVEQKMRQRGGKSEILVGDLDQERAYYNLLEPKVRFVGDKKLSEGNLSGLEFNGKMFVGDPHCPPHKVDFLNKESFFQLSAGAMTWQNTTTGGDILAWVQNEDAFVARAAKYSQLGTNHRRGLGSLRDLTGFTG